jgi:hypothetical protein
VQGEVSKCFGGVEGKDWDKLLQFARREILLTSLSGQYCPSTTALGSIRSNSPRQSCRYWRDFSTPRLMSSSLLAVERISDLFGDELATLGSILLKQKIESAVEPV